MAMRAKNCAGFVVLCLALFCAAPAAPTPARADQLASASVIGGSAAAPGQFPSLAFVVGARGFCTGSVVAPNVVLTAAHCVTDLRTGVKRKPRGYRVITGSVDWAAPERQVSAVTRIVSFPHFSFYGNDRGYGDIALLKLAAPTSVPPIQIAGGSAERRRVHTGARVTVAGWGRTSPGAHEVSETLVWARLTIEGTNCEELPGRVCAIDFPHVASGICSGDSGGPLMVRGRKGGWIQIGISEAGYTNCSTRRPSIFTRVDAVGSWLRSQILRMRGPRALP